MDVKIECGWGKELRYIFESDFFKELANKVKEEYRKHIIYPTGGNIFRAFNLCPFDKLSVVIVGQDPYHEPLQANGLAFSVNNGIKIPHSLRNIFKEIENDLHIKKDYSNGDLSNWAKQGVLLLNSILTVRSQIAGSHKNIGWEIFTNKVIKHISNTKKNIVYILWGNYAKSKANLIDSRENLILTSVHPSPLSANQGFFNNHHFSLTNKFLMKNMKKTIDW